VRALPRTITYMTKWGPVQRRLKGRVLKPGATTAGYPTVVLEGRTRYIHHCVLEAFVGPRPPRHEAAHGDGDPSNSVLANLPLGHDQGKCRGQAAPRHAPFRHEDSQWQEDPLPPRAPLRRHQHHQAPSRLPRLPDLHENLEAQVEAPVERGQAGREGAALGCRCLIAWMTHAERWREHTRRTSTGPCGVRGSPDPRPATASLATVSPLRGSADQAASSRSSSAANSSRSCAASSAGNQLAIWGKITR
jgi:hypothetical protein